MPENKKISNHDRQMAQLREAYEGIHLLGWDEKDDWKNYDRHLSETDDSSEGEFNFAPGAYDDWINSDDDEEEEGEEREISKSSISIPESWKPNLIRRSEL